jgi:dinuclear metal center YbgI/SA1388 family protein
MNLRELAAYLDDYLAIRDIADYPDAYNGLQVEGRERVERVALAVDACAATIEGAAAAHADLLLVHHGLFWGAKAPITGPRYRRLAGLIRNGIALYSCHLPLDAHPEVGNNHVLARALGLQIGGCFGEPGGAPFGVWAEAEVTRDELVRRLAETLGTEPRTIAAGPTALRRIAVVSGGAGDWVGLARDAGCDTLVTGEGPHHTFFAAEELGVNLIYAGHYATETVGVRALGEHLRAQFGLETRFLDHPTGL